MNETRAAVGRWHLATASRAPYGYTQGGRPRKTPLKARVT
jgi:hypothetical protein